MKKVFASVFLIVIFLAFTIFYQIKNSTCSILKIIEPALIQADLNNNGIADDDEMICVADIKTFMPGIKPAKPDFVKDIDLTGNELTALGYIAMNTGKNILSDKQVKLKFTGKRSHDCRFADIYVENQNYSDLLFESGLAAKNGIINKAKFLQKLEDARKLKLVIYNNKSNKYHKTDCKYGVLSSDYIIMNEKELPEDAVPCKFCHVNKSKPDKILPTPKTIFSGGSVRLILSDYTKILKPDRNCKSEACIALLNEINNAKVSIDMAIYGWDMIPPLYNAFLSAHNRGVKIRVVYDRSTSDDYYKETATLLKIADEHKSDYKTGNSAFTNQLMHNKFFIFDNKKIFTGSMNISSTGTSGFNADAVVIIESPDTAKLYTYEFEQMLSGKFHSEKSKSDLANNFTIGSSNISIYFSPYDNTMSYIVQLIDRAESYIYIPTFLITHNKLSQALIAAKKRGVDVKVIIDANSTSTRNTKHIILRQNNIPLKTENFAGRLHSKSIIIDDKYVITGSMNFSNSGENKNDENTIIIENFELARTYKEFFNYLWQKIPDKWLKLNAKSESLDSIGSCSDGVDNDFDGYIDGEDTGCF